VSADLAPIWEGTSPISPLSLPILGHADGETVTVTGANMTEKRSDREHRDRDRENSNWQYLKCSNLGCAGCVWLSMARQQALKRLLI